MENSMATGFSKRMGTVIKETFTRETGTEWELPLFPMAVVTVVYMSTIKGTARESLPMPMAMSTVEVGRAIKSTASERMRGRLVADMLEFGKRT
jgi:hypothetical protein